LRQNEKRGSGLTNYILKACYHPAMDEKREQRIHAAFKRCDVGTTLLSPPSLVTDDEVQVQFSGLEWTAKQDGTETELEICLDDVARATRLASELRACGMVVGVAPAE
jgi:hypothetical protein